jgi:5-methylthioribose kinase
VIFWNVDAFQIWYDSLGHPGVRMIRKIIGNCKCHNLKEAKNFKTSDFIYTTCVTGKLILRPSPLKIHT